MLTKSDPSVFLRVAEAPRQSSPLVAVKALLIDIDDTIVRVKPSAAAWPEPPDTSSLLRVLRTAGVKLAGLSGDECEGRIQKVQQEIRWWHWSDFIVELGLDPRKFWEFAYETESQYLEATGPEIKPALQRLHNAGILLYVASNNPSSGILHKLRMAGLGEIHGCPLFSQLLGGTELHAMKWEPQYWKKALAHIGMDPAEVAVVGDDLRCDWLVPHSIGINCAFQIHRSEDRSAQDADGLFHVQNFDQITEKVLSAKAAG